MSQIALASALLLISLLGITLNSLVLFSLSRNKQLNKIANIFFFNQALADVLFLSLLPLVGTEYYLQEWRLGETACKALIILDSMNQFTSVFLLTAMTIDRYISLTRPLVGVQFRTSSYAWAASAGSWVAAIVVCCPLWFSAQSFQGGEGEAPKCYFMESGDNDSAEYYKWFTIWAFCIGFAIPLLIISSANFLILGQIKKEPGSEIGDQATENKYLPRKHQHKDDGKRRRTCVIVITCTGIFVLCWFPLYGFLIYVYFFYPEQRTSSSLGSLEIHQSVNASRPAIAMSTAEPTLEASSDILMDHIRMACLLLSYCNGMFNPMALLVMSNAIRKNILSKSKRSYASSSVVTSTRGNRRSQYALRKKASYGSTRIPEPPTPNKPSMNSNQHVRISPTKSILGEEVIHSHL